MAAGAQQLVVPDSQVGLAIFGSLVTEMSPPDLPEGVSPDNQDIVYYPGGVKSRPGLRKLASFNPGTTVTWCRTYRQPNNVCLNLYLLSDGNIWVEQVDTNPGVFIPIGQVTPGSYCNSELAFGRIYMAFHDGLKPTDIPLQYDGTYLDRVSQSGPGAPPAVVDAPQVPQAISNWLIPVPQMNIVSATQVGTLVTIAVTAPHGLYVGDMVAVDTGNVIIDNLYKPIMIEQVPTPTSFAYNVGVTGLPTVTSGIVDSLTFQVTTGQPHGLITGDSFTLSGTGTGGIDNNVSYSFFRNAIPVTSISQQAGSNVVTVVLSKNYAIAPGMSFALTGTGNNNYEQGQSIQTCVGVIGTNSFTYIIPTMGNPTLTNIGQILIQVTQTSPPVYNVRTVVNPTTITASGVRYQVSGNTGTLTAGGLSSQGPHKAVCLFQTRSGYITPASTPVTFNSIGGTKYSTTQVPIGPPNTVKRIIAFTGATGTNFFYVPVTPMGTDITGKRVPIGTSTVINDNTSTSAIFDIADNSLFSSIAIDIPGNNMFNIKPLGPSIGCFYYALRMFWWGGVNFIPNLLNMDFNGGYNVVTTPLGWTLGGGNGQLVNSPRSTLGMSWQVVAGSVPATGGLITQPAYQDFYGVPILQPNTAYTLSVWLQTNATAGTVFIGFVGTGLSQSTSIPVSAIPPGGGFVTINLPGVTPATIPSGAIFAFYTQGLAPAGAVLTIDEIQVYPTLDPVGANFDVSYVANPESFDDVTGHMQPDDDSTMIMTCFGHHDLMHFLTQQGLHSTRDVVSSEPSGWSVVTVSNRCGAASPRACDVGENFAIWISAPLSQPPTPRGMYVYYGGDCYKVSQENQPIFDTIVGSTQQSIWVKNDVDNRRILCGIPVSGATAPNEIYVLDYRELDTAADIASRPPVHISFTGKMICSDLSRKSTIWNIAANYASMLKTADTTGAPIVVATSPIAIVQGTPNPNTLSITCGTSVPGASANIAMVAGIPNPHGAAQIEIIFLTTPPFTVGQTVSFAGLTNASWLNGYDAIIGSISGNSVYSHAGGWLNSPNIPPFPYGPQGDTGTASLPSSISGPMPFSVGQTIGFSGLVNSSWLNGFDAIIDQIIGNVFYSTGGTWISQMAGHGGDMQFPFGPAADTGTGSAEEFVTRPSAVMAVCGGNGLTPNTSPGFGNLYWMDDTKLTDDDYGTIVPYYTTYLFVNHEMEIALQVGLGRKLYKGYSIYITGVGMLKIIPYPVSMKNPWPSPPPPLPLSLVQTYDLGDGLNISAERCAFKIASIPLPGTTDNQFDLQKFIIEFRKEPVTPTRFGAI